MTLQRLEMIELVELPGRGGYGEVEGRTRHHQHEGTRQGTGIYLKGPQEDDRLVMRV